MHIVTIHILNPKYVAILMDMVNKVQTFFTRPLLAKYSTAQTISMFLEVVRRCTSRQIRVVAPDMVGAHISCYAHNTRL